MRGWGVPLDMARGRAFIDESAGADLPVARRLQDVDEDLDEITPEADNRTSTPASRQAAACHLLLWSYLPDHELPLPYPFHIHGRT